MKILPILIEEGIIEKGKAKELEKEAKRQGKTEEEIVLENNIVSEDILFELKSQKLKIPLKKINIEQISEEVLNLFSEEAMTQYKFIPLFKEDSRFEIGMVYPEDERAQEFLRYLSRQNKFQYEIFLVGLSDFEDALKKYRTLKRETTKALEELKKLGEIKPKRKEGEKEIPEKEEITAEAPIVKIVSTILEEAVLKKASDIHIEPTKENLRVRFRIDGILKTVLILPLELRPSIVARIKILANLKIDETRLPQGGRFSKEVGERKVDFRVSTIPTILGEKVALRVLDPLIGLRSYQQLGLTTRNLEIVKEMIKRPHGLILVVGPTGSGKTTTLYAFLQELNKESLNIVTIEDPIEYFIDGINQSQVQPEINYTFATALREVLRQTPDVIMVGEIRDKETASLAVHASLTGHIVLSTLHTNNAIGVIPRLIDMGVEPFLIPSTLSLVIAQRLIRVLCPHCKKKTKPNPSVKDFILRQINSLPDEIKKEIKIPTEFEIFVPLGCKKCEFSGYLGRTGVFEVLKMTDSLAAVITEKPTPEKLEVEAKRQNMITMLQDGILKVLNGTTSIEEILRINEEIEI
jgi:type IV pilus assembly protein PilB